MSGLTFCLQAEYPERESEKCHTEGCAVMNGSRKKLCELTDGECARVAALETGEVDYVSYMGTEQTVKALEYLPRMEQGAPGSVKEYKVYVY